MSSHGLMAHFFLVLSSIHHGMDMPQLIICQIALYNSVGTITFLNLDVYSNV